MPAPLENHTSRSSSQAPYPSPCRKRQGSLIPLLLLSPRDPLALGSRGDPGARMFCGAARRRRSYTSRAVGGPYSGRYSTSTPASSLVPL